MENPRFHLAWTCGSRRLGGTLLGMHLFHHKTRKKKFTSGVPLMLAAQILLLFFLAKAGLLFFA